MRRHPPEIPHFTCPAIDQALYALNGLSKRSEDYTADEAVHALNDEVQGVVAEVCSSLEELRKANDQLRRAAHYWMNHSSEQESELNNANNAIAQLEEQLDDQKAYSSNLQFELNHTEAKYKELLDRYEQATIL